MTVTTGGQTASAPVLSDADRKALEDEAKRVRALVLKAIASVGSGHIGGSLSIVDALLALYRRHMRIDPQNPRKEGRDRFVLSKGHGGPGLYAVLCSMGYFPEAMMLTLNQGGTRLPSHPDMLKTPGVDMTTGSLGQGLSAATGMALASRTIGDGARVYALLSDGDAQEGQTWEAALYAGNQRLGGLIAMMDANGQQIDGATDQINGLEPLTDKWRAFGWSSFEVDGHDFAAIDQALSRAEQDTEHPTMIVLRTVKGRGVSFIEEMGGANHSYPFSPEDLEAALRELAA